MVSEGWNRCNYRHVISVGYCFNWPTLLDKPTEIGSPLACPNLTRSLQTERVIKLQFLTYQVSKTCNLVNLSGFENLIGLLSENLLAFLKINSPFYNPYEQLKNWLFLPF